MVQAAPSLSCGTYEFQGVVREKEQSYSIKIFEHTTSEIVLHVPSYMYVELTPFVDLVAKGELEVSAVQSIRSASVVKISKITHGAPDPLAPKKHSQLKLMKEGPCSK